MSFGHLYFGIIGFMLWNLRLCSENASEECSLVQTSVVPTADFTFMSPHGKSTVKNLLNSLLSNFTLDPESGLNENTSNNYMLNCIALFLTNATFNASMQCPAWLWNSSYWTVSVNEDNLLPVPLQHTAVVIFTVLYLVIICLAVLGNTLVLVVIGCVKRAKTVTDMYIISLASSDFMIATLNMPFQLYFIIANEWLMGGGAGLFLCKFSNFVQGVGVFASILTLLFIALDR